MGFWINRTKIFKVSISKLHVSYGKFVHIQELFVEKCQKFAPGNLLEIAVNNFELSDAGVLAKKLHNHLSTIRTDHQLF